MNSTATATLAPGATASRPKLDGKPSSITAIVFVGLLAAGLLFTGYSLFTDVSETGALPRIATASNGLLNVQSSFSTRYGQLENAVRELRR